MASCRGQTEVGEVPVTRPLHDKARDGDGRTRMVAVGVASQMGLPGAPVTVCSVGEAGRAVPKAGAAGNGVS